MNIVIATLDQLEDLVPLFDAYRVFYDQPSDLARARNFLRERMQLGESTIFVAYRNAQAVGFTQLYPSFSSTTTERLWVLNDLYIIPELRGQRVGEELIERAVTFGRSVGAKSLELATAITNASGQKLYERAGFIKDTDFLHYTRML